MTSRVLTKYRTFAAEQFIESFSETSPNNLYMFLAKDDVWDDENSPDIPVDTVEEEYVNYDDMIALKKIPAANIELCVPRHDWNSGTVYAEYDSQDENLFTKKFYVLTEDLNVYKCLWNNGGAQSTVEPTGTGTSNITTGDGYIWKYLYTLSGAAVLNFVSNSNFLTLDENSSVVNAAVEGIDIVKVTAGGAGYTSATATITGDGTGATADVTVSGGEVTEVTITNEGTGYTNATVTISGDGTGATARAIIPPKGGHGADPKCELGARRVMIISTVTGGEGGDFPTNDDYRKIGLIIDPLQDSDDTVATDTTYTGAEIKKGSGDIIFVDYRRAVPRDIDHKDSLKLIMSF